MLTDEERRLRVSLKNKRYRQNNQAKLKLAKRAYYDANKDEICAKRRIDCKIYYHANAVAVNARVTKYRKAHKKERAAWLRLYKRQRRLTDPAYALECRLRCRLYDAIHRGYRKSASTKKLLGCSYQELVGYMERKFTKGMTWALVLSGAIHIDHIKPIAVFDLSAPEQQRMCFNYNNLQPLWKTDNLKKGSKCITY